MGSSLTANWVKIEIPFSRGFRRKVFKSDTETCEPNEDGNNNKRKSDSDEFSSCDMTLKELQERSRKKRKLMKSAGLRKQCTSKHIDIKEEESDLETPLSAWKQKLSSKSKEVRKCIREEVCSSLESGVSVEAAITDLSHIGSEDSFPGLKIRCEPPHIKTETLETDCSNYQNLACVANASVCEDLAMKNSFGEFSDEVPKSTAGSDMENVETPSLVKDPSGCCSSEVSLECMELCDPDTLSLCQTVDFGKVKNNEVPEGINESSEGGDMENVESNSFVKDPPRCSNEPSLECMELCDPVSLSLCQTVDFGEVKNRDVAGPISEFSERGDILEPMTNCVLDEAIPVTWELGSDVRESCKGNSLQSQSSCQMYRAAAVELPNEAADGSFQAKELSSDGIGCGYVSSMREEVDGNGGTSGYSPQTGAESVSDSSPITGEYSVCRTDGLVSAGAQGARECLSIISNTNDGSIVKEVFENQPGVELDCLPRRLLSSRKAISPTSQKKLRQAVDFEDLYDDGVQNPGPGNEGAAKVSACSAQVIAKPRKNNGTSRLVPKGILKASHVSAGSPHSTESSSIPSRVQKAVAFSQRQMQDIESLALKLINELKGMKDIVEGRFCSDEYSSTPPKYTVDQMKAAVQNAEEVEDTAKRWLSMMSKDCNRFCKIMKSAGKRSGVQRKKITFADEAGGTLCHVKILDDCPDLDLSPESESVESDLQS